MRFSVREVVFFERDVRLRIPFGFGVTTLRQAPQAFVRARIQLEDGKEAEGGAAELMVPKWFDKNPALSADDDIAQLRASLAMARDAYLAGGANTAFGHSIDNYGPQIALAALQGMNNLVAAFGPALVDRALLDALGRALGQSFFQMIEKNIPRIQAPGWQEDLQAFDMDEYLDGLKVKKTIAARHTVGLVDPIVAADVKAPVGDGLPETMEQAVERYGHTWFKLKVSGERKADLERLAAIASVLDRLPEYRTTLDCNEQFDGAEEALALWNAIRAEPRLARLARSVAYIEQPIKRANALSGAAGSDVSDLAEEKPVIIDESDDSLEAFPRARRLGYTGVSSKACKGFYKSILNSARCRLWNREEGGGERYFMSGEDLTTQAGLAVQQDLALVALLGLAHVERNGHHYVNGMSGLPEEEQDAFLKSHEDLYERSGGAVRLKITGGNLQIASLGCPGFASGALPDWRAMKEMAA